MSYDIFLTKVKKSLIKLFLERFKKDYSKKINEIKTFAGLLDFLDDEFKDLKGVFSGKNFEIGDYTKIDGALICDDNVKVLDYGYIRGTVIAFNEVKIGSEVKNSIILNNTKSTHRTSYVGDSIIGENVSIGSGVQFSNLRIDNKSVKLRNEKELIEDTKRRKFGAVVEDNCSFGVNSFIYPGTYIIKGRIIVRN